MTEVRPLQPGDVDQVLRNLRPADREEISALVGEHEVAAAVRLSAKHSQQAWALAAGDEVIAVFGVAPVLGVPGVGSPWCVGTPAIKRVERAFMRESRAYIPRMLAVFPYLVNVVDPRNTRAVGIT